MRLLLTSATLLVLLLAGFALVAGSVFRRPLFPRIQKPTSPAPAAAPRLARA